MSSDIIGTRIGNAPVPISILDFAMAGQGLAAHEALAASVELAVWSIDAALPATG